MEKYGKICGYAKYVHLLNNYMYLLNKIYVFMQHVGIFNYITILRDEFVSQHMNCIVCF